MKQSINEIKRMQQLAGIITEAEENNGIDTIFSLVEPLKSKYSGLTFTKDSNKNIIKITGSKDSSRAIRIKLEKSGKYSVIVFETKQFFGVDDFGKEFNSNEGQKIADYVESKIKEYEIQ